MEAEEGAETALQDRGDTALLDITYITERDTAEVISWEFLV